MSEELKACGHWRYETVVEENEELRKKVEELKKSSENRKYWLNQAEIEFKNQLKIYGDNFCAVKETIEKLKAELSEAKTVDEIARLKSIDKKYYDLIMVVENKYEGETRHETAKRFIKEAEDAGLENEGSSELGKP